MTGSVELDVPGFGPVPVVERTCPACNNGASARTERTDTPPEWPLVRCGGCGFVYLSRGPTTPYCLPPWRGNAPPASRNSGEAINDAVLTGLGHFPEGFFTAAVLTRPE